MGVGPRLLNIDEPKASVFFHVLVLYESVPCEVMVRLPRPSRKLSRFRGTLLETSLYGTRVIPEWNVDLFPLIHRNIQGWQPLAEGVSRGENASDVTKKPNDTPVVGAWGSGVWS